MTTVNNNYSFHLNMTPTVDKYETRNIDFGLVVRDSDGKIADSLYKILPEEVLVIDGHPEAKAEDFVRNVKDIKDPVTKFLKYGLIEQMGYQDTAKALRGKNTNNKEIRVFDTIEDVKWVTDNLNKMKAFIKEMCQKYNLDSKAVKNEITRANKVLRSSLNVIA